MGRWNMGDSRYTEELWEGRLDKAILRGTGAYGFGVECFCYPLLEPPDIPDEPAKVVPVDQPEVISISARAFVRTMILLAWTAFRHPFSVTVIDLSTGKIRR